MAEPEDTEDTEVEENEDPELDGEDAEGDGDEEQQESKQPRLRLSPKKLAIVAASMLVLLGAGGYFMWDKLPVIGSSGSSAAFANPKVYYNLPEMVVNLSSRDTRAQYLKLKISLEAKDQMVLEALTPVMPRVLDMFQLYLRELRSSDLEGSAGIYRLKEELLRRINLEIHPHRISRVLFNEIIIQ